MRDTEIDLGEIVAIAQGAKPPPLAKEKQAPAKRKYRRKTNRPKWSKPAEGLSLRHRILAAMEPGVEYARSDIQAATRISKRSAGGKMHVLFVAGLIEKSRTDPPRMVLREKRETGATQRINRRYRRREDLPRVWWRLTAKGERERVLSLALM